MPLTPVAAALARARSVFMRRPKAADGEDAPAAARWQQGLRFVTGHPGGAQVVSDMPSEVGGSGDQVTPGWLFRAGMASCAGTSIAMTAAAEGVALAALEVHVSSRSDARGLLGVARADGSAVFPGPGTLRMAVRIAAPGVPAERLRGLVATGVARAPVSAALRQGIACELSVDVE